jgi:hypothetical protein
VKRPWDNPDELGEASDWLLAVSRQAGPVQTVKQGSISCVLKAGPFYLKWPARLPYFAQEARATQALSRLFPKHIPAPLACDERRGYFVLPDLGEPVGWFVPFPVYFSAYAQLFELQMQSQGKSADLLEAGCIDRRLPWLAARIDRLLSDLEKFPGVDPAQIQKLQSLGPRLKELCGELESLALPYTLVHGDFHLGNVARSPQGFWFFDWTDACLSHPFFDAQSAFGMKRPEDRELVLEGYLRPWRSRYSQRHLSQAMRLARPLIALNQAVSYHSLILDGFEGAQDDFGWAMPMWTQRILENLPG